MRSLRDQLGREMGNHIRSRLEMEVEGEILSCVESHVLNLGEKNVGSDAGIHGGNSVAGGQCQNELVRHLAIDGGIRSAKENEIASGNHSQSWVDC
jgi:hypothetical protein